MKPKPNPFDNPLTSRSWWYRSRYDEIKPLPGWAAALVWLLIAIFIARVCGLI